MTRVDSFGKWRVDISSDKKLPTNRNSQVVHSKKPANQSDKPTSEEMFKEMLNLIDESKKEIKSRANELTNSMVAFQKLTDEKFDAIQSYAIRMHNLQNKSSVSNLTAKPVEVTVPRVADKPAKRAAPTKRVASTCFPSMPVLDAETDREEDFSNFLTNPPKALQSSSKLRKSLPTNAPKPSKRPLKKSFDADGADRRQTRSTNGTSNSLSKEDLAKNLPTLLIKLRKINDTSASLLVGSKPPIAERSSLPAKRPAEPSNSIKSRRDSIPATAKRPHKSPEQLSKTVAKTSKAEDKTHATSKKPTDKEKNEPTVYQQFLEYKKTKRNQENGDAGGSSSSSNSNN